MSKYIRYFFLLVLTVLIFSCKKKTPEDIGLPILPGEDILNAAFTDTATLITHTVRDDSMHTSRIFPLLLGNLNDPACGVTKASIFTQLSLSKTSTLFGTKPKLDSAVLSIVYNAGQYYGTLYPQKFNVYEITEPLSLDSFYYSDRMFQYSRELGSAYIKPRPDPIKDSVKVDTLKYPPHLRINLDKVFFQRFLDDTTFYTSITDFQKFFKGIYIASSSGSPAGQGAIMSMNLSHQYSRITLFYHNTTDTTSYYFTTASSACAHFSHFEHDYSFASNVQNQLNTSPSIQEDKVFVQPMGGLRTKITFPWLKTMFGSTKVTINKAEIILPIDQSITDTIVFSPNKTLLLVTRDSSTKLPFILSDIYEGANYFGGSYDATKKGYTFNIARYVQQILNGTREDKGIYITTYAYTYNSVLYSTKANRVALLGGSKALPSHMRLKITYTPVK